MVSRIANPLIRRRWLNIRLMIAAGLVTRTAGAALLLSWTQNQGAVIPTVPPVMQPSWPLANRLQKVCANEAGISFPATPPRHKAEAGEANGEQGESGGFGDREDWVNLPRKVIKVADILTCRAIQIYLKGLDQCAVCFKPNKNLLTRA